MKVFLGHLYWGLGTKDPHSDPADKNFLGLHIVGNVSKRLNLWLKWGKNFCRWLLHYFYNPWKYQKTSGLLKFSGRKL